MEGIFGVRVGGCGVEIVVALINVFAVAAFRAAQSEQTLLENGIARLGQELW